MCITLFLYKATRFKKRKISYGSKRFDVSVADSMSKQMLGLMHRGSLGKDEGMLFTFGREGKYDIWMLNMKFSIDILWLDGNSKILKIVENAAPCKSMFTCNAYESPVNAKYVIELNAGTVKNVGIKTGRSFRL